ncbi:hypothetical protein LTR56_014721 [Elasticomyces elasticus]|nr:hypothetical protein LTR56_014721 [Elasticomyces elasticus]KAK3645481.1 hypothetical protein LTR22_014743 [Elasticomyces elasticus]KAK4915837.1 hypothetical protein LTR49_016095 [Elasticomyces elasticus]KAK5755567.1 hypothetical protein LTS12_014323 [Elasticomyces elasticus]
MVRFYATTTLLALLATFTAASPPRTTPNTQSCGAVQHNRLLWYTVYVGVTYANGNGCAYIGDQLKDRFGQDEFGDYRCTEDDHGDTLLKFACIWGRGQEINEVLHRMYPMVNGFNCPSS